MGPESQNKHRQRVDHVFLHGAKLGHQEELTSPSTISEMPPRRSSRAPSAQPVSKPPSAAVEVNGINGIHPESNKRSPSVDRPSSPPPKRLRSDSKKSENLPPTTGTRKPPSRTAKKGPEVVVVRKSRKLSPVREAEPAQVAKPEHKQLKPYFNQVPTPPQPLRPGLLPFVWGAGNFGQFGLGPEYTAEISKPKKHNWMEKKMDEGVFGEPGAGIESVAAGGLHTVFIDEKGTVCHFSHFLGFSYSNARSGRVARTTMLLWDVLRKMFLT